MPRRELFDLAIERADTYLSRLVPGWERNKPNTHELAATIELWYLRTRFAYRVPLEEVVAILLTKPPAEPDVACARAWRGGPEGSWQEGRQGPPGTDSGTGG